MDGLFFYWIIWMGWVVAVFFLPKTTVRSQLICHILILIILSGYELAVYPYRVGLGGLYLLVCLLIYNRKLSFIHTSYFVFKFCTIGIGYAAFQLFALLDPIILIFDASWMQAIAINYTAFLLFKDWKQRISAIIIGMVLGDCVFAGLLAVHTLPYKSISLEWLDNVTLSVTVGLACIAAELISKVLYQQTQAKFNS